MNDTAGTRRIGSLINQIKNKKEIVRRQHQCQTDEKHGSLEAVGLKFETGQSEIDKREPGQIWAG